MALSIAKIASSVSSRMISLKGLLMAKSNRWTRLVHPTGIRDKVMLWDLNFSRTAGLLWDSMRSRENKLDPPSAGTKSFWYSLKKLNNLYRLFVEYCLNSGIIRVAFVLKWCFFALKYYHWRHSGNQVWKNTQHKWRTPLSPPTLWSLSPNCLFSLQIVRFPIQIFEWDRCFIKVADMWEIKSSDRMRYGNIQKKPFCGWELQWLSSNQFITRDWYLVVTFCPFFVIVQRVISCCHWNSGNHHSLNPKTAGFTLG